MKRKKKPVWKKLLGVLLLFMLAACILTAAVNLTVCLSVKDRMCSLEQSLDRKGFDCIIVLGCGVWGETPPTVWIPRLPCIRQEPHQRS